ncbi:hypothetical protein PQJ75_29605 [Rhodoplanes sp. TEM]|uniref:Uncharacterized protein n=1 Tax=Rhodoplanes tepidamans TaxID=200616 RepID=A0ABT5JIZ5_RHOTP|nr:MULTISPECIES: hypothetical protein [Rhodoplanes]MDC7789685.1 hypothetical protein [Rhodoplanes tepidamans]MDC7987910.1 hypothetical protein [Rhodoplanes sp. TEM]MDQ0359199.1 hypothetical protein [Rhodoplanes tepidamans]
MTAYAGYAIEPFEREPGLWRAVVRRAEAAAATSASADLDAFTTSADAPSRDDAIRLAQAAIDAGLAC